MVLELPWVLCARGLRTCSGAEMRVRIVEADVRQRSNSGHSQDSEAVVRYQVQRCSHEAGSLLVLSVSGLWTFWEKLSTTCCSLYLVRAAFSCTTFLNLLNPRPAVHQQPSADDPEFEVKPLTTGYRTFQRFDVQSWRLRRRGSDSTEADKL